jgi:solute carrier family 25 folate transporter 32
MAGGISDVICNPMFVVRTRLQTEALHDIVERGVGQASGVRRPTGMIQTAKSLYSEGGPLVFWRGMTANLMGLSHAAIQFPVYEQLKKTFRHDKEHESALDLLLASGLSKMTASMISYPHEVIRSRMMDARAGMGFVQTCQSIYTQEGMVGFYAGLPVSMIRVIPNTCITFLTYELILRYARTKIREHRNNGNGL